jgi:hypothetical protein
LEDDGFAIAETIAFKQPQIETMAQVALVAYYGEKPPQLFNLITACQQQLKQALGAAFLPYEVAQVHATILGMEQSPAAPGENDNFVQHRRERRQMDFAGLLETVRTTTGLPLTIQLGAFADRPYPFTSRGCTPYDRSFTQQGDKAVLMGWPVDLTRKGRQAYPEQLDVLRRAFQPFNFLHKYHRMPQDVDNDFYFRIGLIDNSLVTAARLLTVAADLRHYLSIRQPLRLPVGQEQLCFVAYQDERLPTASTRSWPVDHSDLTADMLSRLYEDE